MARLPPEQIAKRTRVRHGLKRPHGVDHFLKFFRRHRHARDVSRLGFQFQRGHRITGRAAAITDQFFFNRTVLEPNGHPCAQGFRKPALNFIIGFREDPLGKSYDLGSHRFFDIGIKVVAALYDLQGQRIVHRKLETEHVLRQADRADSLTAC